MGSDTLTHTKRKRALFLCGGAAGTAWAVFVADGILMDWNGRTPLATDPSGDGNGADLINVFAAPENQQLFFRADFFSNHPPTIDAQTFSLAEKSPNGTPVGTPVATDPDAGQTPSYAITAGNSGGPFAIDAVTGQITVANSAELDFKTTPSFALTVEVTDNGVPALSDSATVTVDLIDVNEPPSFTQGADQTVLEDAGAQTVPDWATAISDGDAGSQTLTFTITVNTNPALFAAGPAISPTGALTYAPAPNAFGTATITVTLKDDGGTANGGVDTSGPQTFTIAVTGINDPPSFTASNPPAVNEDAGAQALPDWASFNPGNAQEAGQTVLAYTVSNLSNAALFSAQPIVAVDGTLTYTPATNANGTATFDVAVQDNGGTTNGGADTSPVQSYSITVTAGDDPPVAVNDAANLAEDAPATALDVLANDTDPDGGPKSITSVTQPTNGTVVITDGGTGLTYRPNANYCNTPPGTVLDTFTYTLTPGGSSATVSVTVNFANDHPVVDLNGPAAGLDFVATFTEGGGAVAVVDNANLSVSDVDNANLASATVTLTNLLDAGQETLAVDPTTVSPNTSIGATYNTGTPGQGVLTLTGTATLAQYQAVLRTLTYNNSSINPNPIDRGITFVVNDGIDPSALATATVTIIAINSAPSFTVRPDQTSNEDAGAQTVNGWATGISDGDGDTQTLTFNITSNSNAALFSAGPALSATGELTYTPAANANGTATITVTLSDDGGTANGGVDTSTAQTFTITVTAVNDAPSFIKGADQTVNEDAGAQTVNPWATALSAGPADESGQTLTFAITANTNPSMFAAGPAISPTGILTYTPAANASGTASITLTLADNGGTTNGGVDTTAAQTFAITVNAVDDPPVAVDDTATVDEDSIATAINVLANDTDTDAGPISITSVTQPANGEVAITGGGTGLTYQPNANYCNSPPGTTLDTFTYTLNGGSNATVTITVTCVDDPPSAVADSATVDEDSGANAFDVLANDTDPDGGPRSITSVTQPANGAVVITGGGTGLTYQPNANYCNKPPATALDTFTYTLTPGSSTATATATVSVTVNCLNDAPVIALPGPTVAYDTVSPVILDATATVSDGDSPNFDTGVLTANVTTNCDNGDRLGVRNEGAGDSQIGVSGTNVTYNPGSGAVSIGTITAEFDCSTAAEPLLAITLTANADLAAMQALLRNLTYFSASITPPTTQRTVAVILTDGVGGTSNTATKAVNIDAAPTVQTITPTANATGVAIDAIVAITFSEDVTAPPAAFAINCVTSGNHTFALSGGPASFTLNPNTDFANGETCTVTVTATQVTDQDLIDPPDNMVTDFTSTFTTVDIAPTVLASSTPANAAVVATTQTVTVNFSEKVDLTAGALTLNCPTLVAFTSVPALPTTGVNTITLTPTVGLSAGASCTLTVIAANVSDSDTVDPPDTMASNFTRPFTVDAAPTFIGSSVSTTTSGSVSANGATHVLVDSNIAMTFSESVAVSGSSFTLDCGSGSLAYTLGGTGTSTVTLNPNANLPGGANCIVTINGNSVSDSDGIDPPDTMTSNPNFSFTTQSLAENDSYTVTPHLTLAIDTGIQSGPVTVNDQLGSGAITDFGVSPNCDSAVPNGTNPVTTSGGGLVVFALNGSFVYIPPAGASNTTDSFCYKVTGGDAATVTFNLANTELVWFVDAAYAGTNGVANGTQGRPFTTLTAAVGFDTDNDTIFVKHNAGYTCGITLLANEKLIGEGSGSDLVTISGITPVAGSFFPSLTNSSAQWPTLTAATNCVTLGTGNTIRGFNFGNVGATTNSALTGSSFGTLTVNDVAINTNGRALNLNTGTLTATLAGLTSTGGDNNLTLTNVAGVSNFGGGALSGATSHAFNVDQGAGSFTYAGTINNTTTARSVNIISKTSGTVNLNGAINGPAGVNLNNNTGATINFTGGVTLNTGVNAAFTATGGGTVNVTGANNLITTTTGTALNVANTVIGASGLTFRSISANGAANGILLNNTGVNGGLTVTGTGTTDGSGGTIQNINERGASFISASNITLNNMNFTNTATAAGAPCGSAALVSANDGCNAAIHLNTVSTVALENLNLTTSGQQGINGIAVTGFALSNSALSGLGNGPDKDGLHFHNMLGTSSITNTTITSSGDDNVNIQNLAGTSTITISGGSFNAGVQGSGLLFGIRGTSNTTINISGATLDNNFSGGIVADSFDTATMKLDVSGITNRNNNDGIQVSGHNGSAQFDIHDNSDANPSSGLGIYNNDFIGATLLKSAFSNAGMLEGQIKTTEVTIPDQRPTDSILVFGAGGNNFRTAITNNTFSYRGTQRPITVQGGQDGAALIDTTITSNAIDIQLDGTDDALGGILANVIIATPGGDGSTLCADIGGAAAFGNAFTHSLGGALAAGDIRVRQRNGGPVRLPGYAGAGNDNAAVITYLNGRNTEVSASTATNTDGLFSGGGACIAPVIP